MPPKKADAELGKAYTKLLSFFRNKDTKGLERFLDEKPIDLNREIILGEGAKGTILHLAVVLENLPIVQLLVERGADIYKRDTFNNRPIDLARKKELYEIASYLARRMSVGEEKAELELDDLTVKLLSAFQRKELESVRDLLNTNAIDLNREIILGKGAKGTFLQLAVVGRSLPIVQLLLKRGADICAKDSFGRKPIDIAREEGLDEIVSYLQLHEFYAWPKTVNLRMDNNADKHRAIAGTASTKPFSSESCGNNEQPCFPGYESWLAGYEAAKRTRGR